MRKFVFHKLKEHYEEIEKASKKNDNEIDLANPDKSKIPAYANPNNKPKVSPKVNSSTTYTTKMNKKK
jgi:hypothetical protein